MKKQPQPYELVFDERKGYLYAGIKADLIEPRIALDYFAEIADKCASIRCKRILLDRDIPAMLPDKLLHETMKKYVEMSKGLKIAFVNKHLSLEKAWRSAIDFTTTHGADFSYFDDHAKAETWLLG